MRWKRASGFPRTPYIPTCIPDTKKPIGETELSENDKPNMGDMDFRMPESQVLEPGQLVTGTVVLVGDKHVFLDVGGKSEASIDLAEVINEDGDVSVEVGQKLEAYIVSVHPEVVLSRALAKTQLNIRRIEDAKEMEIPVEGTVTGTNKGGLEVDLVGARGFCPISQVALHYCEDPTVYIGQTLQFRVTEFAEEGRNIVLSRRALLAEEQEQVAEETRSQLQEGAEFTATVVTLQPYGAFVDIGGMQGLVHISEVCHGHIEHPNEVLKEGESVRVKVLRVEADPKKPDRLRVGLSIKALLGDPWQEAAGKLSEGTEVEGTVVRLQPFGAFVQVAPGVDGLVHISELADRRIEHPSEVVEAGQKVTVTVLKLDLGAKRISLSLRAQGGGGGGGGGEITVGSVVDVTVGMVKPFGLLVNIKGGGRQDRGLIPAEETGAGRQANLRKAFPEGKEFKAMITTIEPDTGKMRLSIVAYKEQEEQGDFSDIGGGKQGQSGGASSGTASASFGTLGDLLKGVLKDK